MYLFQVASVLFLESCLAIKTETSGKIQTLSRIEGKCCLRSLQLQSHLMIEQPQETMSLFETGCLILLEQPHCRQFIYQRESISFRGVAYAVAQLQVSGGKMDIQHAARTEFEIARPGLSLL